MLLDAPVMELLRAQFLERRARYRNLGVGERRAAITARTLRRTLQLSHVPLVATSALFYGDDDLLHWVAVTGLDDAFLYFNTPDDASLRERKIGLHALEQFVDCHGDQSMVKVWRS